MICELGPQELQKLLTEGKEVAILDVRQPEEYELVRLNGAVLIPLMELKSRICEIRGLLSGQDEAIVYCRTGIRSRKAIEYLQSFGIVGLKNLRGGINAYASEVDTSLVPY